jgi:hypothetical protein
MPRRRHSAPPGARCTICNHVERERIERSIAYGVSIRAVSKEFAISHHATWRHWANHVSAERRASYVVAPGKSLDKLRSQVVDENLGLIEHYRIIRAQLYVAFDVAAEIGDRSALDRLAARLHENLRDIGRLTGELQAGLFIQNNILVDSPDFNLAIAAVISAVTPFPEARNAVITALRDLEKRTSTPLPALRQGLPILMEAGDR